MSLLPTAHLFGVRGTIAPAHHITMHHTIPAFCSLLYTCHVLAVRCLCHFACSGWAGQSRLPHQSGHQSPPPAHGLYSLPLMTCTPSRLGLTAFAIGPLQHCVPLIIAGNGHNHFSTALKNHQKITGKSRKNTGNRTKKRSH